MRTVIGIAATLILATPVLAETKEAYICYEQESVGFSAKKTGDERLSIYNEAKFSIAVTDDAILILKDSKINREETYFCRKPFSSKDSMTCRDDTGFYMINFQIPSMNFYRGRLYPVNDDVVLSRGTCQKF